LLEGLLEQVEAPGLRLRGGEAALGSIAASLHDEVRKARERAAEVRGYRVAYQQRLLGQEAAGGRNRIFQFKLGRLWRPEPEDTRQVWAFFCLRLEELIDEGVLLALQRVQASLNDWGQEMTLARRKLADFSTVFPLPPLDDPAAPRRPGAVALLPYKAGHLGAAVTALLAQLPAELPGQLDRLFQGEVLDAGGGLWALLTRNASTPPREELMKRARALVGEHLKEMDLASLLLEGDSDSEPLEEVIGKQLEAARRMSTLAGSWQHILVGLPEHSTSPLLHEIVQETLADQALAIVEVGEALVVHWETAGLSFVELANRLAGDEPDFAAVAAKLHTRRDVPWTAF
jgi:hypothetical protein